MPTLGPSSYCVHRLAHTLEPSMLLHVYDTFDWRILGRAQDTSMSDGVPLPPGVFYPPFPLPPSSLIPVYYSPSSQCIRGGVLPWLGHRLSLASAPRSPVLYHQLVNAPYVTPLREHQVASAWALRTSTPFHWRRLASVTSSRGLPSKARDVLLRTLFRSLQVHVRLPCPHLYKAFPICGLAETLVHRFFECQALAPLGATLLRILHRWFSVPSPAPLDALVFTHRVPHPVLALGSLCHSSAPMEIAL